MKRTSYRTEDGAMAFVFSPSGSPVLIYYIVKMKSRGEGAGRGPKRIVSPLLPTRLIEENAQKDLDNYARLHGWKPAYVN